MKTYIDKQLEKVDFENEYPAKIKIVNGIGETNWIDISYHTLIQVGNLLKISNK